MKGWDLKYIQQLKNTGRIVDYRIIDTKEQGNNSQPKKRSKYNNKKTVVNGVEFDSEKEANYYKILLLRRKAGEIGLIELQKEYELNKGGAYSYKYFADFVFVEVATGETKVIDVKGFKTREYIRKRRLMLKVHGITIIEV
jgi:hypothetical protein